MQLLDSDTNGALSQKRLRQIRNLVSFSLLFLLLLFLYFFLLKEISTWTSVIQRIYKENELNKEFGRVQDKEKKKLKQTKKFKIKETTILLSCINLALTNNERIRNEKIIKKKENEEVYEENKENGIEGKRDVKRRWN